MIMGSAAPTPLQGNQLTLKLSPAFILRSSSNPRLLISFDKREFAIQADVLSLSGKLYSTVPVRYG